MLNYRNSKVNIFCCVCKENGNSSGGGSGSSSGGVGSGGSSGSDVVQQSQVSSSKSPSVLANDIIGPLLLEVCTQLCPFNGS